MASSVVAAASEEIIACNDITCKICSDVYTDARNLSCGHTFCSPCLMKSETRECPECKKESVPDKDNVKGLTINVDKNKMVRQEIMRRAQRIDYNTVHNGVECDSCHETDFTGARFVCGVCPSYNLCEKCESKPKDDEHDRTHIFVKLKRSVSTPVPQGPLLSEVGQEMGREMIFDRTDHRVVVRVDVQNVMQLQATYCSRCMVDSEIITGTLFRCGYCKDYDLCKNCETRSEIVHDPSHVFLAIRHPINAIIEEEGITQLVKYKLF